MKLNKATIIILIIIILLFVLYGIYYIINKNVEKENFINQFSFSMNHNIQTALVTYIAESGDKKLTFGGTKSCSDINILMDHLINGIMINSKHYGPYINKDYMLLGKKMKQ